MPCDSVCRWQESVESLEGVVFLLVETGPKLEEMVWDDISAKSSIAEFKVDPDRSSNFSVDIASFDWDGDGGCCWVYMFAVSVLFYVVRRLSGRNCFPIRS